MVCTYFFLLLVKFVKSSVLVKSCSVALNGFLKPKITVVQIVEFFVSVFIFCYIVDKSFERLVSLKLQLAVFSFAS